MRNRVQFLLEAPSGEALFRLADRCLRSLEDPVSAYREVSRFVAALGAAADAADPQEWALLRKGIALHPLMRELGSDPLIHHMCRAGRRTAAPEMTIGDLMLRHPEGDRLVQATEPVGRNIHAATSSLALCDAVRDRRRLLARYMDAASERRFGAEVLAIDPGYMREAQSSIAGPAGAIGRWVALVGETKAAAEIARSMPLPWVVPIRGNVLATLLRPDLVGQFDVVYCKTLETMADAAAEALVVAAFARLKPGGRLLLSCRAPGAPDSAFWTVVAGLEPYFRDEAMLSRLAGALDPREVASRTAFSSVNEAIAYLEVVKA